MLEKIVNINLLKSPMNWAIVFLMCALGASLLTLVIVPSQPEN